VQLSDTIAVTCARGRRGAPDGALASLVCSACTPRRGSPRSTSAPTSRAAVTGWRARRRAPAREVGPRRLGSDRLELADVAELSSSASFSRTGTYDEAVIFPVGGVGVFDYASLLCTLPASRGGTLFGVTSIQ